MKVLYRSRVIAFLVLFASCTGVSGQDVATAIVVASGAPVNGSELTLTCDYAAADTSSVTYLWQLVQPSGSLSSGGSASGALSGSASSSGGQSASGFLSGLFGSGYYTPGSGNTLPVEDNYVIVSAGQNLTFSPFVFGNESTYRCVVTDDHQQEVFSDPYTLSISPEGSVSVALDPSQSLYSGDDNISLTCSALGGPANMFQWLQNDVTLTNETDTFLNITASVEGGGVYTCVVSNAAGSGSDSATVNVSPTFTVEPIGFGTEVSVNHMLECNATGFPPPTYQWFKVGGNFSENVTGENTSILSFNPVYYGDEGDYYCQVMSGNSTIDSNIATVAVSVRRTVVISPANGSFAIGDDVNLNCSARGGPRNMFQWYQDGMALVGENSSVLTLTNITLEDGAEYECEVRNFAGPFRTTTFVFINPQITQHPSDVTGTNGAVVMLVCQAEAFPDPTYEWTYSDGSTITLDSVEGIDTDTLLFLPALFGSEGSYVCMATANNVNATSDVAVLYLSPGQTVSISPRNATVSTGDNVTLTCSALGGPNNTFAWEHEAIAINVTTASLTIYNISVSEGGDYRCTVSNPAGSGSAIATVFIQPIITPPSDIFTANGSSIEFVCEADGIPTPNVTWQRIEAGRNTTVSLNNMYSISPAVFGDEGDYQCVADSNAGTTSAIATLTISPEESVVATPRDISSERDVNQTFNCSALGGPGNRFIWTRLLDGEVVSQMSSLTVLVDGADKGSEYRCTVENDAGNDTDNVILRVAVTVDSHPQSGNVSINDDFTLSCTASAFPLPDIIWFHNSSLVAEDNRTTINQTRPTVRTVTSTITIENATTSDGGTYVCRVDAPMGTDFNETYSDTAVILVQATPERPHSVEGVNITSRNLTLIWTEPHDSNAPILGYRVMYMEPIFQNSTPVVLEANETVLDVTDLRPGITYNFTVVAFNEIGDSPPSDIAPVRTLDEVPIGYPQNVIALTRTSTTIELQWGPVPLSQRNGEITFYEVELSQTTFPELRSPELRNTSGDELMLALTGLQEYVEYTMRVRAYTSAGPGPYSPPVSNMTQTDDPVEPPQTVMATALSSTEIAVSWEEVPAISQNGEIITYEVQYEPLTLFDGQLSTDTVNITDISILFTVLTDLEEYVEYNISVRAYTSTGPGPYSVDISERTDTDDPAEPPQNVIANTVSSTEIEVSWEEVPAISRNGIITMYDVQYEPLETFNGTTSIETVNTSEPVLMMTLSGLEEYVEYKISVRTYTSIGPGPYSDPVTNRTLEDEPGAPPGEVVAVSQSSTSARVNWTEVPAIHQNGIITQYEVEYSQMTFTGVATRNTTTVDPTTLSVTLVDLLEYVQYSIRVRASTRAGYGPYSDITFVTTNEDVPASPPVNVIANSLTSTEILVSWSEVPAIDRNGIITQYEVEYNQTTFDSVPTNRTVTVDSSTTMTLLTGLEEYVVYYIRVRAYTSVGSGPYSNPIMEITLQDEPASPPSAVAAATNSSTSILITWSEIPAIDRNGIITRYEVEYTFDRNTFQIIMVSSMNTMALLTELHEYVLYFIRVRAYTSVGPGPYSADVLERTLEDVPASPPSSVIANAISPTSIQVSWSEVPDIDRNGIITQYEVEYNQTTFDSVPTNQTVTVDNSTTMTQLSGLEEYVVYSIRVRAYTSVGSGPYSVGMNVTTDEDVPSGPPVNLVVQNTSANSLSVSWERPSEIDINGILRRYEIDYAMESDDELQTMEVPEDTLTAILVDLDNYTVYRVSVYAVTIGRGPPANQTERTSENVPGEAPVNVTAFNSSSTSVIVVWEPPPPDRIFGILRSYEIRYSIGKPDNNPVFISDRPAEERMFEITRLLEFTNYSVEVSAITVGNSPFSSPVYVVTDEDIPGDVLQPPVVNRNLITTTTALISWVPPPDPNGIIINYVVHYEAVSMASGSVPIQQQRRQRQASRGAIIPECLMGDQQNIVRVDGSETSLFLDQLTPFLTYEFMVQAVTSVGRGNFSVPRAFETKESVPTAPRNLTVQYLNSTSLKVLWEPPECDYGIRTGYMLNHTALPIPIPLGMLASNVPPSYRGLGADDIRLVLEGLSPNTNYNVTLCAFTSSGCGAAVMYINQTDEDAPVAIRDLVIKSLRMRDSDREVRLDISWTPPSTRNGIFQTLITYTGTQTPNYPPQRSNSSGPTTQTLEENANSFEIMRGLPYAEYTIRVQPFNVKTSNTAPVVSETVRTIAIEPTVVVGLSAEGQSSMSLRVTWDLPQYPNAPISGYVVYYLQIPGDTGVIETDPAASMQDPSNINIDGYSLKTVNNVNTLETVIDGLEVYRYYSVIVRAVGAADSGAELNGALVEVVTRTFSDFPTEQPSVIVPSGASRNTITVSLPDHTYIDTGEVIFYGVIVIQGEANRKQSDYDDAKPYTSGAPYYVTAAWSRENLTRVPENFIIGDETVTYADGEMYLNARLSSGSDYTFFVRIDLKSDLNEGEVHRIRTNFTSGETDEVPSSSAGAAAGAVVAILLVIAIIVLVLVVIIILRRRYQSKQLDILAGEVAMSDMASSIEPVHVTGQVYTNPLLPPHKGTFEPISVREFSSHILYLHSNDDFLFSEEYSAVEPDHSPSSEVCMRPENQPRNRYANIKAYDHSRVKLMALPNEIESDYINANQIDGYRQEKAFIATQGPVPGSIPDFWRMVWEQGTATIVMLTNLEEKGRIKCHKYWPDEMERTMVHDAIHVYFQEALVLAEYTVRTFSLQMDGSKEERIVRQFHYTVWPDHGVPEYPTPLLQFVRKVASFNPMNAGPVVVHCSAGVGRTGTFITLDAQLRRIKREQNVDIFGFVRGMRRNRCYMVQTEHQYIFLHDALLEAIECGVTEVAARDLKSQYQSLLEVDPGSRKTGIEKIFRKVQSTLHFRQMRTFSTLQVNLPKNRYTDREMLPYDKNRCRLKSIPGTQGSDYINASYIDGYHRTREFIATQGPLPDTENDFWRMVWEQKSSTIIMLTREKEKDGTVKCHTYWPKSGAGQYDYLQVILHNTTNYPDYTLREFKIVDTRDESSLPVKQYQYTDWPEQAVPATGSGIIDLIGQVQKWQRSSGDRPIIIHCSGGCGRTGTYIAASILIERLKTEGVVDVFQTVRKLRLQRPGMVASVDQYEFCYKTLIEFLDSFELYANFK